MHFNSFHDSMGISPFTASFLRANGQFFFFFYILTTCTIPFYGLWEYPGLLLDSSYEFSVLFFVFLTLQFNMFPRY